MTNLRQENDKKVKKKNILKKTPSHETVVRDWSVDLCELGHRNTIIKLITLTMSFFPFPRR